jgi:hypothetical protein
LGTYVVVVVVSLGGASHANAIALFRQRTSPVKAWVALLSRVVVEWIGIGMAAVPYLSRSL